jgi:hypothetical protein
MHVMHGRQGGGKNVDDGFREKLMRLPLGGTFMMSDKPFMLDMVSITLAFWIYSLNVRFTGVFDVIFLAYNSENYIKNAFECETHI